jgi:hypothetical protein
VAGVALEWTRAPIEDQPEHRGVKTHTTFTIFGRERSTY